MCLHVFCCLIYQWIYRINTVLFKVFGGEKNMIKNLFCQVREQSLQIIFFKNAVWPKISQTAFFEMQGTAQGVGNNRNVPGALKAPERLAPWKRCNVRHLETL